MSLRLSAPFAVALAAASAFALAGPALAKADDAPVAAAPVEKPPRQYREGEAISINETFTIPAQGMHTFEGTNNKIQYFLKVEVLIAKWPDVKEDYTVTVVPERLAPTGEENR